MSEPTDPMSYGRIESELATGGHAPACLFANPEDGPGAALYAAYNRAGEAGTAGLNFRGDPCPEWPALPQNIRNKWDATAKFAADHPEILASLLE